MTIFQFPLINAPQTFEINLAGVNYIMTSKWNPSEEGGWVFDLSDSATNSPLVANAPMITGVDCLSGLEYLGINGQIIAYTDGNPNAVPTYENLGLDSNLYFGTDAV